MSNAASTPEFREILKGLYDSGKYRDSGSTLKAAWAEYHRRHGQGSLRFAAPQGRVTYSSKNPRKKKPWKTAQRINPRQTTTVVEKLPKNLQFISDSQDTEEIKKYFGKHANKFDSFFVRASEGDYDEVWGMKGIIPNLSKSVVLLRKLNPQKNSRKKKARRKNPIAVYNPKVRLTKLPASQVEIRYKRTGGKYAGKWFKHEFKSSLGIYGMSDGSVLLKSLSGKKLWGTV